MDINKKRKQHVFDSYCKTILRNKARDYYEHLKLKRQNEISLSDLSEKDLEKLSLMPNHFATIITSKILKL